MSGIGHLALRLAGAGINTGSARLRSVMVMLAATIGALILLALAGIVRAESAGDGLGAISQDGIPQLLAAVVITVSLPVLVLAATAGRLSASVRDQRLANLRLLGMTPLATRLVAAIETGVAACVGTAIGWGLSFPTRTVITWLQPTDTRWTFASLSPDALGYLIVLLSVPLAVTAVSATGRAGGRAGVITAARRADIRRPGWWRVLPLALGVAAAVYVIIASGDDDANSSLIPYMFFAIAALGIGIVLVVPVLVRLIADALVHRRSAPAAVITGRRLQVQPAGTARVIGALLIGLFVVTGAQAVIVAFEQVPQYQDAATIETTGQVGYLTVSSADAPPLLAQVQSSPDLAETAEFRMMTLGCTSPADEVCDDSRSAVVGSCADLLRVAGPAVDCRSDEPAWVYQLDQPDGPLDLAPGISGQDPAAATLTLDAPAYTMDDRVRDLLPGVPAVFIPSDLPGVTEAAANADVMLWLHAEPGVEIMPLVLNELSTGAARMMLPDMSYYRFVAGLRTLATAVAAVVLAVGILAFGIGAIDRAIDRRRDITALQLAGVDAALLRRSQWLEAALPLGVGLVLAIGSGALAGGTYLAFAGAANQLPWRETGVLALIAVACAVLVAGITVIAANPRIRPELIRTQ